MGLFESHNTGQIVEHIRFKRGQLDTDCPPIYVCSSQLKKNKTKIRKEREYSDVFRQYFFIQNSFAPEETNIVWKVVFLSILFANKEPLSTKFHE